MVNDPIAQIITEGTALPMEMINDVASSIVSVKVSAVKPG